MNSETEHVRVLIKFSSENPDITVYPERRLTLSETDNTVSIGRSSKDSSKDLVAHHTNAYFDCRVMSRKHAEIVVDTQTKSVSIRDLGSTHGTYANGKRLVKNEFYPLADGDKLTFGIAVIVRYQETHTPTTVKVGVDFQNVMPSTNQNTKPGAQSVTFGYNPDDDDYDSESGSSEVMEIPDRLESSDAIDLTGDHQYDSHRAQHFGLSQVDGAIDLTSDMSDSEHDDDSERFDDEAPIQELEEYEGYGSRHDADCDLLGLDHATPNEDVIDDEDAQSSVDDNDEVDNEEDDNDEDDNEEDDNDEDVDLDEQYSSYDDDILSEDEEEGVFIYNNDDMDDEDVSDFDNEVRPETAGLREPDIQKIAASTIPLSMGPALKTPTPTVLEGPFISPRDVQPKLAAILEQRAFSPSDVADPRISVRLPSIHSAIITSTAVNTTKAISIDSLLAQSGKAEFFAAREDLKQMMRDQDTHVNVETAKPVDMAVEVQDPGQHYVEHPTTLPQHQDAIYEGFAKALPSYTTAKTMEMTFEVQGLEGDHVECPRTLPQDAIDGEGSAKAMADQSSLSLLESGEMFLNSPLRESPVLAVNQRAGSPNEAHLVSANALHEWKQTQSQAVDKSSSDLQVIEPTSSSKGKRKAADISDTTDVELLLWPGCVADAFIPTLSPSQSPSPPPRAQSADAVRPTKRMRSIAERVGYAALGGATVGAMVLTSLICSAPNFA